MDCQAQRKGNNVTIRAGILCMPFHKNGYHKKGDVLLFIYPDISHAAIPKVIIQTFPLVGPCVT